MSTALAIAAVTAVLKGLLENGLAQSEWASAAGNPSVSALPPDRVVAANGADPNQLNLFLYLVTPNTGWSNQGLASRDRSGQPVSNPPLALNLHYLLTAYGTDNLHAEILLGCALQLLHETPGLGRDAIRTALNGSAVSGLPAALAQALAGAQLADQFEQLKITPQFMNPEELSKMWSALQTHYRPTAVYQVSVVLLESRRAVRAAPPVLQRGPGDFGVAVQANLLPPVPTLVAAHPANGQPSVRAGLHFDPLRLFGHHFGGGELTVVFQHVQLALEITLSSAGLDPGVTKLGADTLQTERAKDAALQLADAGLEVNLQKAAPQWAAGAYRVAVRLGAPSASSAPATNEVSVTVAPEFATTGADQPLFTTDATLLPILRLTCAPAIHRGQKVSLVLGDRELTGTPEFPAPPPPVDATAKVVFRNTLPAAMKGTSQLARLRVAGVDSLFILRPEGAVPTFDPTQKISVPA